MFTLFFSDLPPPFSPRNVVDRLLPPPLPLPLPCLHPLPNLTLVALVLTLALQEIGHGAGSGPLSSSAPLSDPGSAPLYLSDHQAACCSKKAVYIKNTIQGFHVQAVPPGPRHQGFPRGR